jgi:uncharacterized protein (DUF4415 family)
MSIVRYKRSELPPLTVERLAALKALSDMPDDTIDYSDIPQLSDDFWKNAAPNPLYKPVKKHASIRLDADVLEWMKSQGKGYQTRINAILRNEMLKILAASSATNH